MKRKFIPICLFIITFLLIALAFGFGSSYYQQPLMYGEDTILQSPSSLSTLPLQSNFSSFLEAFIPLVIGSVVILLIVKLAKRHSSILKKYLPKVLCVVLCLVCLGSSFQLSNSLADSNFTPISTSQYYGRQQLEKMANSSSLLYAYDQMATGIENQASEIKIRTIFNSVTFEEWQVVLYSYLYDYPQHFWMDASYRYSYVNGSNNEIIMHAILPNYAFSSDELTTARAEFNTQAQSILDTLSPSMSEYELEFSIHNQLCDRIIYQDVEYAHTAYGGLVTGVAVCEGYGKAFQYLLNQVGIESTLATGTGTPAGSGVTENHAWNLVKIDGNYYYTDLTWDDQTSEPYYAYFNVSTAMLEEDHTIATFPYELPLCTVTTENYFVKNNKTFSSFSLEKMIELLQYDLSTHVYVTGATSSFNSDVLNNSRAILNALDMVTSSTVRISSLGRERVITVVGHRRGDVNGDNILDETDVTLLEQYLDDSSVITDANCLKAADYNDDGKIDAKDSQKLSNYVDGIVDDTPSSIVSSDASVSSAVSTITSTPSSAVSNLSSQEPIVSSVSIPSEDSSSMDQSSTPSSTSSQEDMPSYTLGDVNKDTKIDAKDALLVLKMAVGKYTPFPSEMLAADVNKDDAINAKDALEILKKAVGKPACF